MKVVKPARIREFIARHADAKVGLENWLSITKKAQWTKFIEVKKTFPSVDQVRLPNKKCVLVFNIAGNAFRLICAAHYNTGYLFVLRLLTHKEYSKNFWKREL